MKNNLIGTVDKIKPLKLFPEKLVRFSLMVGAETVNCICGDNSICDSLMFMQDGQTEIAVYGIYNSKHQLVIKKLVIRNPTSFEREFAMMRSHA